MSSSALAAGLRQLCRKLAAQGHNDDSDVYLLQVFLSRRDDGAFAALVRRHGPMVLHVCRRVLGHEQDAEDAFQATFLVLARNAAKLRKKTALASWLHGIAYRIALKAKQTAARRRKHERRETARSSVNPADELSWREVGMIVDEEIARLPEIYRSVFVLCCLESVSVAETARRLGLKEGTAASRLAEARKRLQRALGRRGVEGMALAAAFTLTTPPALALPPLLTSTTIKTALATAAGEGIAGLVSAHVAVLVKSAATAALLSKAKMVAVVLLAVSVLAGAGMWIAAKPQDAKPQAAKQAASQSVSDASQKRRRETVTVKGRVLGPDGKPVKGARLYWPRLPKTPPRSEEDIEIPLRAKTDAEGRFRFELPRSDIRPDRNLVLIAAADGYGGDAVELPKDDSSPEVFLHLVKDQPIEGRIVSTEGKPMAGVNVRIIGVGKTRRERLDDFLDTWKGKDRRGPDKALGQLSVQMFLPNTLKCAQAVTDKDGRFRIQGAGVERMVMVRLRGRGLPPAVLFVVNRAGFDPAAWNKAARDNIPPAERRPDRPPLLYGPKIEYVAPAGRRIEGTVREAGSGKPVPGYRIFMHVPNGFDLSAVSDKEGKYKLLGAPKMKEYHLFAIPPANSPWLPGAADGKDAAGLRTIQVDFTVARGIVVSGRILDRATGKGARAGVCFVPLPGNKFFGKPGYDYFESFRNERTLTDIQEAGRYQLAVMPGPGVLMVQARGDQKINGDQKGNSYKQAEFDAKDREHVKISESDDGDRSFLTALKNYSESLSIQNAVKVLDLTPDAGTVKCDLFLERGETRTIQIEDADGKPLMGTTISGVTASGRNTFTIKDATCTIFALDPKKPRRLVFFHAKRHLAGTRTLRGDEKEPVVVRLKSTGSVIGRVLDRAGQPLAGANVNLILSDQTGFELYRVAQQQPTIRTGKDGRFRLEGIVPEVKFTLGIVQGRTLFLGEPRIGVKQVKSGETLDLGDVRVKPAK